MQIKTISLLSTLGMGFLSQLALAGNITAINVSALPNQQKVVKLHFDKDTLLPRGFTTDNPARIALDFNNTNIAVAQNVLQYNDPLLQQIEAVQGNDRSRVLLNLKQPSQYNAKIKGNEVWIYIQPSVATHKTAPLPPADPTPKSTADQVPPPAAYAAANTISTHVDRATPAQSMAQAQPAALNIDFLKGKNSSGVVTLSGLNNTATKPTVQRFAHRLVFLYKNMPLPSAQQRKLDVNDFNTPVRLVQLRRIGNDTELSLTMEGSWDYKQHQGSNTLTIEVIRQIELDRGGLQTQKSFKGRHISLDFQDVDVRTILQILSKESGMNIVASDSVNGKMTISLKDVPWDQALNLVMDARNLDMRKSGNTINVAPRDELLKRDTESLEGQKKLDELGPLQSATFQLKYRNVKDFSKILRIKEDGSSSSDKNSILSPRGSALLDSGTNTLIITDIDSVLKKFEKLIAQIDVPSQQVMIEARIVETTDTFARELGARFGYNRRHGRNAIDGLISTTDGNSSTGKDSVLSGGNLISPNVNLGVANPTSVISLVHSYASGALALELSAAQTEGKTKIISSPRVLTQDRQEAKIESGMEVPYQEASSSGATSTSFKDAVLGLTVTPEITPDGNIIMTLKVQNDKPVACNSIDANLFTSDICMKKKTVDTKTMIENGGTLIIGGIYTEDNTDTVRKVPLLGDIPIMGNLFKYKNRNQSKSELLVFITPRIVDMTGSKLPN
ncbi:type IV pilus secretin PilQ [Neisseriaceae bacterium ESL0693]|nr:type IV pilus secretin PilQ [Neisseriaceae bacterium ESL0693]